MHNLWIKAHRAIAIVVTAAALSGAVAQSAMAQDAVTRALNEHVVPKITEWSRHPVVLIALKAQNRRHAGLTEEKIIAMDKKWRAERKEEVQPLIAQLFGRDRKSVV